MNVAANNWNNAFSRCNTFIFNVNFQICVLLCSSYLETLNSSDLWKNKMQLRTLQSGNLMPFFSYLPIEIAKIKPREILPRQNRKIKYQ